MSVTKQERRKQRKANDRRKAIEKRRNIRNRNVPKYR